MRADNHDNMLRVEKTTLAEWEKTVSPHQAYLWFHDLVILIKRVHFEIDRTDVMFGEGDLQQRVEWLRKRMEDAEETVTDQRTAIDGLIEAAKGTAEWDEHHATCWKVCYDHSECDCAHDELHAAVKACEEAKG